MFILYKSKYKMSTSDVRTFPELLEAALFDQNNFQVFADSANQFLQKRIAEISTIINGGNSEPLNDNGEYVFADGTVDDKPQSIVIGVNGFLSTTLKNQYDNIEKLYSAIYDKRITTNSKSLFDAIVIILAPYVSSDVLFGLPNLPPAEQEIISKLNTNIAEESTDAYGIQYEELDKIRNYIKIHQINNKNNQTNGTTNTVPPLSNQLKIEIKEIIESKEVNLNDFTQKLPVIEITEYMFAIVFMEQLLYRVIGLFDELKLGNTPDLTELQIGYITDENNKMYEIFTKFMSEVFPGVIIQDTTDSVIDETLTGFFMVEEIQTNTVFKIKENPNLQSVYSLDDTTPVFKYSNNRFGHVFLKMYEFLKFWIKQSSETTILAGAAISGILNRVSTTQFIQFIEITTPTNPDLVRDIGIYNELVDSFFNVFPQDSFIDQNQFINDVDNIKLTGIDFLKFLPLDSTVFQNVPSISYIWILAYMIQAFDVIITDELYERNDPSSPLFGLEISVYVTSQFKASIQSAFLNLDNKIQLDVINSLNQFRTLCVLDGVWNIPALNTFILNRSHLDDILNGTGDQLVGVSVLLYINFSDGFNYEYSPFPSNNIVNKPNNIEYNILNKKLEISSISTTGQTNNDESVEYDFSVKETREKIIITGLNNRQFIPIFGKEVIESAFDSVMSNIDTIKADSFIPNGSIFIDEIGELLINLSKPPRYAAVGLLGIGEVLGRSLTIALPVLSIGSTPITALFYYLYCIAVFNDVSQHAFLGIGQIFAQPIVKGISSIFDLAVLGVDFARYIVEPILISNIEIPVRKLWTQFIRLVAKESLTITNDLQSVNYPTQFTYLKKVDRLKQIGGANVLDGSDKSFIAKLIINEYLYETVWSRMIESLELKRDSIKELILNELSTVQSPDLAAFIASYVIPQDAATGDIMDRIVETINTNIFSFQNKQVLFEDYLGFIRLCNSNITAYNSAGDEIGPQTTKISVNRGDIIIYKTELDALYSDINFTNSDIINLVQSINRRLGGTVYSDELIQNVVRKIPINLIEPHPTQTDSFEKSIVELFDETIGPLKQLGVRFLENLNM